MTRPRTVSRWPGPVAWVRETEPWLRDNQRDAIAAAVAAMEGQGYGLLKHRRGLMLADDVGMGKTWEAIGAVAIYWARHPRAGQPVFLVPPALREKWVAEVREFTERALKLTPPGRFRNAVARIGRRFGDELVVTTSRVGELSRSRLARTLASSCSMKHIVPGTLGANCQNICIALSRGLVVVMGHEYSS